MAYGDYPKIGTTVTAEQDRKFYAWEYEDGTISTEFEGGYKATRPGHLRTHQRRTFKTGWSNMTKAQREALETFWKTVNGTAGIFIWVNPWDNYSVPYGQVAGDTFVRFATKLSFTTLQLGATALYECEITLEEV